jgi:hypothetical protein
MNLSEIIEILIELHCDSCDLQKGIAEFSNTDFIA